MPPRIALATYAGAPALPADDMLLADALNGRGHPTQPVVWNAPGTDWRDFEAVVLRSTWDYHHHLPAFLDWIDSLDRAGIRVINPPAVIRWNTDKRYLRELSDAGVAIVPTRYVAPTDRTTLVEILEAEGWKDAVVKPAVSASAHGTWRTTRTDAASHEARFVESRALGTLLVQPFVHEVVRDGELSLVFLEGQLSHAVRKRAREGDFRVQAEHGGHAELLMPPSEIVDAASHALHAHPSSHSALYARVDGCVIDGAFVLMELELVEPTLYLSEFPSAAERLAGAIVARLAQEHAA